MNLSAELDRWLPEGMSELLIHIGACARRLDFEAYLVGGPVRDLLLGRPCFDLDVVVEGDAPAVARALAGDGEVTPVVHPSFGTATLRLGAFRVDLASARAETYARPGALPDVVPGTIAEDLVRRDFSMNAMALLLDGRNRGELLDPHGGWADLGHGLLRVLHERSFADDPTRILRGVRYEQRFGFAFDERTRELLFEGLRYLSGVSADRVRHEFERTFEEDEPETALLRLDVLGVLPALQSSLSFDRRKAWAFRGARAAAVGPQLHTLYWCLLFWGLDEGAAGAAGARLNLPRRASEPVLDVVALAGMEARLDDHALSPAQVFDLLAGRSLAALAAAELLFQLPVARSHVASYLRRLRHVRGLLNGADLREMGVPDGPVMGRILTVLRRARLNGEVSSKEEETALAARLLNAEG